MNNFKSAITKALKSQYPEQAIQSHGEEAFLWIVRTVLSLPEPEREVRLFQERMWRFDFIWRDRMLAVEVEGGVRSGGRHVRQNGFTEDCRKYNHATARGWKVIRFTTEMVDNGEALATMQFLFQK